MRERQPEYDSDGFNGWLIVDQDQGEMFPRVLFQQPWVGIPVALFMQEPGEPFEVFAVKANEQAFCKARFWPDGFKGILKLGAFIEGRRKVHVITLEAKKETDNGNV
jgi:hypothetical protein